MATDFESYRGKLIALTFGSVIKIGDNDQLPFNTVGRCANVVFENCLRTKEPNALANLTDGDGAVTSLAIGAQNAGAKIFGPVQICNVAGDTGELTTCTFLKVDGGNICATDDITASCEMKGHTVIGTSTVCSCGNLAADGAVTGNSLAITNDITGVNITGSAQVKGATLCSTGVIRGDDDIIAFATSDKNLKNNVKVIENSNSIINSINGYEFDWKDGANKEGHDYGVIAQEVEEVMPEAVRKNSNNYLSVNYEALIPVLIQEVKNLNNRIETLENKING